METKLTTKQYRALRKQLETARDRTAKAFESVNVLCDTINSEENPKEWDNLHMTKGRLWDSYTTLDNMIINLDREINNI